MKRTLFYIFILSLACLDSMAQDAYYYYCGEKVPLKVVEGKVAVRTPLGLGTGAAQNGLRVVHTQNDKHQQLAVCEYDAGNTSTKNLVSSRLASNGSSFMPCYTDDQGLEVWPTGYVSVKMKSAGDAALLQKAARENGLEVVEQDPFMPLWWLLQCSSNTAKSVIDVANRLQESGLFASASPDFAFMGGADISYDPDVCRQWGLYNAKNEGYDVNVSPAWNYATGKGVTIAIIDGGVDITHKDLAANADSMLSYDVVNRKKPNEIYSWYQYDDLNHGTRCAGIAAAVRNNGIQVAGVAPDAKLMTISSLPQEIYLAEAINWAWRHGADVISCSWHCANENIIAAALDSALVRGRNGKGCIIVFSAGNEGDKGGENTITWPANYRKEIIAVASMKRDGAIAMDSSYGQNLFIAAPGVGVLSTVRNDKTGSKSGTSLAAPHVAGVAALILERNPNLKSKQVREILARTAKKVGNDRFAVGYKYTYDVNKEFGKWNMDCGYGLVDAYEAVVNTPRE